jgi:hypothetical protein
MRVVLVGEDAALLEGISQSFAPPVLAVVNRKQAGEASAEALAIPLARGGALVLYHGPNDDRPTLTPALSRSVMADLTLPLERNRLIALAQHVQERIRTTGRSNRTTPPEQQAF